MSKYLEKNDKKLIKSYIKLNNVKIDKLKKLFDEYSQAERTISLLNDEQRKDLIEDYSYKIHKITAKNISYDKYFNQQPSPVISGGCIVMGVLGLIPGLTATAIGELPAGPIIIGVSLGFFAFAMEDLTKWVSLFPAGILYFSREDKINELNNYRERIKEAIEYEKENPTKGSEYVAENIKMLENKFPKKYSQLKKFNKQIEIEQGKE